MTNQMPKEDERKNEPAFPCVRTESIGKRFDCAKGYDVEDYRDIAYSGLTIRDYFAAKAMQGILASSLHREGETKQDIVLASYSMADAMLAERSE